MLALKVKHHEDYDCFLPLAPQTSTVTRYSGPKKN